MNIHSDNDPVFKISVVAEIVNMHPQTIRLYEKLKFITPKRGANKIRFYSKKDIDMLLQIKKMRKETGINIKGIKMFFELKEEIERLKSEIEMLKNK